MSKKTIDCDLVSFLGSLGKSLDPVKVVTELIDNAVQHGGKNTRVIINESKNEIIAFDNGPGFTAKTWNKFHSLAGDPVNQLGCSKYNIGSKTYHNLAKVRKIYSCGADSEERFSTWKSGEDFYNDNLTQEDIVFAKTLLDDDTGTVVVLGGVDFSLYKCASTFFAKLAEFAQERYAYKLYKSGKSIEIVYLNNKGDSQDPRKIEPINFEDKIESSTLTKSVVSGIEIYSYLRNDQDSRYVSEQGVDVFFDDIKIDQIQWLQYSSKRGIINKASHFQLNTARQNVFLTPQNNKGVNIDLHKTNCNLPADVLRKLAKDLTLLSSKISTNRVKAVVKSPVPGVKKTVSKFVVKSRSDFFNRPDLMDLPFAKNSMTDEICMNSDSAFFDKYVEKRKPERADWVSFIDSMFEVHAVRGKKQSDMNFIKEFLQHFDAKLT